MDRAPGHTTAVIPAWEKEEGQTRPPGKNTRSPGSAPSREEAPRLGPFSARSLLLLLLSALFPVSISAQPSSLSTLEDDVRAVLDTVEGDFAVAATTDRPDALSTSRRETSDTFFRVIARDVTTLQHYIYSRPWSGSTILAG
ncbi:hypothetical protein BRD03_05140 [Halobacteriales archaeon QS_9_68_17]|nr:MAG: hypothetical protein BRD03_05140 [Halobacteriales archaeon QS_9_68_17]